LKILKNKIDVKLRNLTSDFQVDVWSNYVIWRKIT